MEHVKGVVDERMAHSPHCAWSEYARLLKQRYPPNFPFFLPIFRDCFYLRLSFRQLSYYSIQSPSSTPPSAQPYPFTKHIAMSVTISSPGNPSAPIKTYNLPDPAKPEPQLPPYNKHRDGDWPETDLQRAYVKDQRARYHNNLVRLFYTFEDIMCHRLLELDGDDARVQAETDTEVQAQANYLYYDRVWNKECPVGTGNDFMREIHLFWRDVGTDQERRMYERLWEFVSVEELSKKLMTAP